jgi:hypothetical protein
MSRALNDKVLPMETTIQKMMLWYDLHRLQEHYVSIIDTDRLEEWPDLFTEDCIYEIVPKENADLGLPVGIMHCFGLFWPIDATRSRRFAT